MKPIARTLRTFLRALRHNKAITCSHDGMWNYESSLQKLWRKAVGDTSGRISDLAKSFVHVLDKLETTSPVVFGIQHKPLLLLYIKAAKTILMQMESNHLQKTGLFQELSRRFMALLYRLEDANGGFSRQSPDASDQLEIRKLAIAWKENNPLIPDKALSEQELDAIREACTYPLFVNILLGNEELQNQFFEWTIRDKNLPGPFIQFPAMQQKITTSNMAGRIGRVNPNMLKITYLPGEEGVRKVLTLPFEGIDIDILNDQNEHTFRGDYTLQVSEVFNIFSDKYAGAGNLEFLAGGVTNWNYLKCARWNEKAKRHEPININRRDWWKELPPLETLSLEQMKKRYGDHVDGVHWNIAAAASRGSATLDYEATHAYLNIGIPNGDGSYNVYDFGKLANVFPTTFLEKIRVFAFNVHASVAYPDESIFYSFRQHTYYSIPMDEAKAHEVMESIRQDMVVSTEDHFVYQIESDNCARWAQHKIEAGVGEDLLPNLFQMHLLATEPSNFTKWLFAAIRKAPMPLRTFILTRLHFPLGAGIGTWIIEQGTRVCKSLSRHEFFETGLVYLPAYLHRQQEIGLLGTVIDCVDRIVSQAYDTLYNLTRHMFDNNDAKAMPGVAISNIFTLLKGAFPPHLKDNLFAANIARSRLSEFVHSFLPGNGTFFQSGRMIPQTIFGKKYPIE